ncbi:ribosome silencing factor [Corynebacterium hansenii]|uniref:Ribosomal silencing factor RsfS n=1 Tax=Corynebacterium hansenii TaxID=394964 RepID=A0ABV7ZJQ8_9CORY|nr:ribosome silencing factor [Corynebacterium hansenii]WJY99376.1 Ribosomal silencing factor RsfS [Corynebacterium hansenii]
MTASTEAANLATIAARAADRMKGEDIAVIDVSGPLVITDAFVLVSADNERLVSAIVDEVEDDLRDAGAKPVRREGVREGRWALLDYGVLVVHVFRDEERDFYGLDRLWKDCPRIEVEGVEQTAVAGSSDASHQARSIDEIPLAAPEPDAGEF